MSFFLLGLRFKSKILEHCQQFWLAQKAAICSGEWFVTLYYKHTEKLLKYLLPLQHFSLSLSIPAWHDAANSPEQRYQSFHVSDWVLINSGQCSLGCTRPAHVTGCPECYMVTRIPAVEHWASALKPRQCLSSHVERSSLPDFILLFPPWGLLLHYRLQQKEML